MSWTKDSILSALGIAQTSSGVAVGAEPMEAHGPVKAVHSPIDGAEIAKVQHATPEDYDEVVGQAVEAFKEWRMIPAPKRGEIVRQIGNALREYKEPLGALVTLEMGKILQEGMGEVQEMIDVCDFAVGQARMMYGLTMHSERPGHRMYEQWHPLGAIGIISAFNFPVAVWAWNAMLAAACGDTTVWKPSSATPLTAVATINIANKVLADHGFGGIFTLAVGSGSSVGDRLVDDPRLPLVSLTGSIPVGKRAAAKLGARLATGIMELGGNNAIILHHDANLDLALRGIVFAAVGTSGQRCTSLRRLIVHKSIAGQVIERLQKAYESIMPKIGNPLDADTIMGPLVNQGSVADYTAGIEKIRAQGGEILFGGKVLTGEKYASGLYVEPTLVRANQATMPIMQEEIFAPILYVVEYDTIDEAIAIHNGVPQGLSSAMFTSNFYNAEQFLSHRGSDCGIANINIGTSGAEIGGAFGGEKETGFGRESGSDSWKQYMRRQTCTMNWSTDLPLAQGIEFPSA